MKLELGALQFTIKTINGEMEYGFPKLEILQDNMKEIIQDVPDGEYKWILILDIDKAEKA